MGAFTSQLTLYLHAVLVVVCTMPLTIIMTFGNHLFFYYIARLPPVTVGQQLQPFNPDGQKSNSPTITSPPPTFSSPPTFTPSPPHNHLSSFHDHPSSFHIRYYSSHIHLYSSHQGHLSYFQRLYL